MSGCTNSKAGCKPRTIWLLETSLKFQNCSTYVLVHWAMTRGENHPVTLPHHSQGFVSPAVGVRAALLLRHTLYPGLLVPKDVCKIAGDNGSSLRLVVVVGGGWEEALD